MMPYIVLCLSSISLGFLVGRWAGIKEGARKQEAYAPLALSAQALQEGTCPICRRAFGEAEER